VRRIAVPGALVQMAVATAAGRWPGAVVGLVIGAALVFGISLSVASTVVLLRALEARGVLDTQNGRIAVGWLIVEDLAMVLVLVLLPALAGGSDPRRGRRRTHRVRRPSCGRRWASPWPRSAPSSR
jgi:monovalent cation:H+ antiporter-2, CPA2 family